MSAVSLVFGVRTLEKFEDASASIPIRNIARAFDGAEINIGEDAGASGGARRIQFRRYIAGVNQHDPQQLDRLGDALGALIGEVATSKVDFLIKAAQSDGFVFTNGVFRAAQTPVSSFALTRVEEFTTIDDRGSRLALIAGQSPSDAVRAAAELVESLCRTVLRLLDMPLPKDTDVSQIAKQTLDAVGLVSVDGDDASERMEFIRTCLLQNAAFVANLAARHNAYGLVDATDGRRNDLSIREARLAVKAAVMFAGFVAEAYVERRGGGNGGRRRR